MHCNVKEVFGLLCGGFVAGCAVSALVLQSVKTHISNEVAKVAAYVLSKTQGTYNSSNGPSK